ncbi:BppU family phage baseplate upper protein [Enterococcus faecium]|uniref:BppU family phage baseplate upper protein n=1 Tax=Enterococcus faecium TaxID=1352 RepID=UPI00376F585F
MAHIIKKGPIKVPTQPKDFDLQATGLVFKSYDNQIALEFNVAQQDGAPADLLGANLRLLMFIYDEVDGTIKKEPIPFITKNLITESFLNGHVVYILPEAMKAYNGMVEAYVYIEYPDGSTSDNLGFTFRMKRSAIDGLAQDKADYFIEDFKQLLDGVKQEATDAVNEALAKVEVVSENVSSAQNDLTILEDRIDQANQEIDKVLSGANGFRTDIDTLKINKADKTFVTAQLAHKAEQDALNVEKARIDTLIALPDGSTTNDARLEDITAGADGITYDSPGNAVRGQYRKVDSKIERFKDSLRYIGLTETDAVFTVTENAYAGSSGYVGSSNHDSYEVTLQQKTTLYFESYDSQYTSLCVYTSGTVGGDGYTRYRIVTGGENTLPTIETKKTLPAGTVIIISVSKDHGNFKLMQNGGVSGFYLSNEVKLNSEHIKQFQANANTYLLTYVNNELKVVGNGVDCVFNDLTFTLQHGLFELQNLTYNGDIIFGTNNDYIGPVRVNGGSIKGAKHDGETTDSVIISTNNGILTNGQSTVCHTFTIFVRSHISDEFSRLSTYTFNGKSLVTNSLITTLKALQIDYIFGCGIISCQDDVNVAWINKTELTKDVMIGLNNNTTIVCDHGTLISKRLSVNSEYGDSRVAFNVYNGRKKLYYYTCYGSNLTVPIDTVFASCVELQFM